MPNRYLDAFWADTFENDTDARELVWKQCELITSIDKKKGKKGKCVAHPQLSIFLVQMSNYRTSCDFMLNTVACTYVVQPIGGDQSAYFLGEGSRSRDVG